MFVYELTWCAPGGGGVFGACHTLDLGLVFGTRNAGLGAFLFDGGSEDEFESLSAEVRRRWVAFADHGDPGWTPYDPVGRPVQVIDLDWNVAPYPEENSRRIWADERATALPLLASEA